MTQGPARSELPVGVRVRALDMHVDDRGVLAEIFREEWDTGIEPVQWNAVRSEADTLRGVHVHVAHDDYLVVLAGRATIGLRDLRRGSPTEGLATTVELGGDRMAAITTPPGVAHGFHFPEPTLYVYATSTYWDPPDEIGCMWDDPELEIPWSPGSPIVSERDASAPPLSDLVAELESHQPIGGAAPPPAS